MSARGSMLSIWANQRQPWFKPWGANWSATGERKISVSQSWGERDVGRTWKSFYPLLGAVGPLQLDQSGVESDHPRHPLQKTVLTFDPGVVHAVAENPVGGNTIDFQKGWSLKNKQTIKLQRCIFLESLTSGTPPQTCRPSLEGSGERRTDISYAGGPGWGLPPGGAAPKSQRPPRRWGKLPHGETLPPPHLVSTRKKDE